MRIALTGATGFAGGPILNALTARGHEISALVRNPASARLPATVRLVQGNLHDQPKLSDLCKGADVLVHVAGAISARSRDEFMRVNFTGTENIVRAAMGASVKRIVHISSLAARNPWISDYAASKHESEKVVAAAPASTIILRPSAVYGAGDKATLPLLKALMQKTAAIPGTPPARFSLIEVTDLAAIVSAAAESNETGTRELDDTEGGHNWADLTAITRVHYGCPVRVHFLPRSLAMSAGYVVSALSKLTGQSAMITPGKVRELYFPDWVVQGAGWPRAKPVLLREGLVKAIDWYINAGWIKPPAQKAL
jgi:uncharacterized protein YbjT (DUF2867 family)